MPAFCGATVQPIRGAKLLDLDLDREPEQRHAVRQSCLLEFTSQPLVDMPGGMNWGGVVRDLSAGGLKLDLCYPFRPGTYLALDLQTAEGKSGHALVCRVVHVQERRDGCWTLGCEFLEPLTESAVDLLL